MEADGCDSNSASGSRDGVFARGSRDSSGNGRDSSYKDENPTPFKRRRFTAKKPGCTTCGGPCLENSCIYAQLAQEDSMSEEDSEAIDDGAEGDCAADAFAKAVEDHRLRRLSHVAVAATSSSSALPEEPPRKKRKRDRPCRAPEGFGRVPAWLSKNPTVGKVKIHQSHSLGWHRGLIWCWRCGHYGASVPIKLRGKCSTLTLSGEQNLCRLRQGKPPQKSEWPHGEYIT